MAAGGSGSFTAGTNIYQGASLAAGTVRGEVVSWDSSTRVLRVINIDGTFSTNVAVTDGTASWTLSSFDDMTQPTSNFAQNLEVETLADSGIVDFTESNPFGNF